MSARLAYGRGPRVGGFLRDESGTTLVEYAIVNATFLLILFGLIDFGRLGYNWVMAEKAMQRAARIAAVRPPVCTGVPDSNERDPDGLIIQDFGATCAPGVCVPIDVSCLADSPAAGTAAEATAIEIWDSIAGLMPGDADRGNLTITYRTDPDLGFLGGPFVPVVTVEITGLAFNFTSPLGGLAQLAGATSPGTFGTINFPAMAVSLPGEDLAQGTDG